MGWVVRLHDGYDCQEGMALLNFLNPGLYGYFTAVVFRMLVFCFFFFKQDLVLIDVKMKANHSGFWPDINGNSLHYLIQIQESDWWPTFY